MKLRIILSAIVCVFFYAASQLFSLYYSPITGVATAQSLNDDSNSYVMAKFIREGGVNSTIFYCALVILALIWISPFLNLFRGEKK
jgi:hypothetical protein